MLQGLGALASPLFQRPQPGVSRVYSDASNARWAALPFCSTANSLEKGISAAQALHLGIVNKAFEPFERQLVADTVQARIPQELGSSGLFGD